MRQVAKFIPEGDLTVFLESLPKRTAAKKRAIGLDLGTTSGLALLDFEPGKPVSGLPMYLDLLDLSIGDYDSGVIRLLRLRSYLEVLKPDLIGYEQVRYTPPGGGIPMAPAVVLARAATPMEFLGNLKGTLGMWAEENSIPNEGFPIGTIKRRATGKGNADKLAVLKATNQQLGAKFNLDTWEEDKADNMADAAWVLVLALEKYARGF